MAVKAVTGSVAASPYVGNRSFLSTDSNRFYGRSEESREVAALWRKAQLTILSGRSGVGKTSLLNAGVIPLVTAAGADVLPVGRVGQGTVFPVAALPEHNPYTLSLLASWAPGEAQTRLSGFAVYDFLRRRPVRTDPDNRLLPVLVVLDQAEDLFTWQKRIDRYREPFFAELAEALEELPQVHLLVSLRDDYVEDFRHYQDVLGASVATFPLSPLTVPAAAEAVQRPLAGRGRRFAAQAAELLATSLGTGEAAVGEETSARGATSVDPVLLQNLCAAFWAALPEGLVEITAEHVVRYADVERVLNRFCDEAVTVVAADHGIRAGDLTAWLAQKFVTELGTRDTAYEGLSHTAGMPNAVARALRDRHILTAVKRADSRWYELHHNCLIEPVRRSGERRPEGERGTQLSAADYLRAAQLAVADGDTGLAWRHASAALRTAGGRDLRLAAEAESLLGNMDHLYGRHAAAEARYRSAAVLFETLQDTRAVAGLLAAVGQTILAQQRYAEAVEYLHSAVGRIPNDVTVQTELAWALWHAGHRRAAVDVLTGVLSIDAEAEDARRARGEILADLGDAEDALRDLDRVQRHQQPSTRAARGLALATVRGVGAADSEIDAALSGAPGSGSVLIYAARVAVLGDDPTGAADLARRAVNATDPVIPPHQRIQAFKIIEVVS